MQEQEIEIQPGIFAHATGAVWVPETSALLVADAHLGYGFAQRRRGELGPLQDDGAAENLLALARQKAPREIVFLGDLVHAPRPSQREREFTELTLNQLLQHSRVVLVQGNHDRGFSRDFGHLPVALVRQYRMADRLALHGDRIHLELPEANYYLLGHLHPAFTVKDDAGANRRIPAFLSGERACVLPAFSPYAAGFDITLEGLPAEVAKLLGDYDIYPATGRRIVKLPRRKAVHWKNE
jgi:putative SbcD/Mre11-related phosphoesterase